MAGIELCTFTHGLGLYILRFYPSLSLGVNSDIKAQPMCKFAQLYACHELFLNCISPGTYLANIYKITKFPFNIRNENQRSITTRYDQFWQLKINLYNTLRSVLTIKGQLQDVAISSDNKRSNTTCYDQFW